MKSIADYMKMIEDAENGVFEPVIDNDKAREQDGFNVERIESNVIEEDGYKGHITQVVNKKADDLYYVLEIEDGNGEIIKTLRIYHFLPKAEPYEVLQKNVKKKFKSWLSKIRAEKEERSHKTFWDY